MYVSKIRIANFRNFREIECALSRNVLLLGENRVGKSNLLFALRLVLDLDLPDSARQLKLTDIWDGCDLAVAPEVRIDLDFTDFEKDLALTELLTDYRLTADPKTSRLTYLFRKREADGKPPQTNLDYEFKIFGGENEARFVPNEVRRRISLDLLHALRDAEYELGRWSISPLRPLLENAISQVAEPDMESIAKKIGDATNDLGQLVPVSDLQTDLREQIKNLAGETHDIHAKFGFASVDPWRLIRSIGFYIDEGKRGIGEASLGSANLALLALKLAEFTLRQKQNERNYTLLCVEEPEAHLHPHLQRQIFKKIFNEHNTSRSVILSSHSTSIAAIAPLNSIVVLKTTKDASSKAFSLANLRLHPEELEDLQRYLDSTRAEILFSRGVLFVEGDAEAILSPIFSTSEGHNFDDLGITVCSVGGVHFTPYVRLALKLGLPFAVVTDWDPLTGEKEPLGRKRALDLIAIIDESRGSKALTSQQLAALKASDALLRKEAMNRHIYLNNSTFEIELSGTQDLLNPLIEVLEVAGLGPVRMKRLKSWKEKTAVLDTDQLMSMIADVGKGRLAGRFAKKLEGSQIKLAIPDYFKNAIHGLVSNV